MSMRDHSRPRINRDELVMITVLGQVAPPLERLGPWRIGADGTPRHLPGSGGIVLSHRVGDRCVGLAADHVEPGVSIRNEARAGDGAANQALQSYACIGNFAVIQSGRALGSRGVVVGKHGGIDNVLLDFPLPVMRRMAIGDRVQVYAYGIGARLIDYPDIRLVNCAPRLIAKWRLWDSDGRLSIPVTHVVPARLMGSGLGKNNVIRGDYDIQLSDPEAVRRHRLGSLRFGDIVAIEDADNRFGRSQHGAFVSVGVVVHSESTVAGHGPGVVTLLSGPADQIAIRRDPAANIATILGIRQAAPPQPRLPLPEREARERQRAAARLPVLTE